MLPRITKFSILDDMFDDPFFTKREREIMKTDIKEKDGNYILDIDMPGCDKSDIKIELNNGYLTVTATVNKEVNDENKTENYLHQERFYGKCSRSYYAGDNIKEEDVVASFKNGILTLTFPKNIVKDESTKKYIKIND